MSGVGQISFGIKTTPMGMTYREILRLWQDADTAPEIEHAWLWDHLQPMRGDLTVPVLEGWTLLAALASQTRRLGLGLLVTNNLIRPPAVLAKIAATTDVISGGRLVLGLGAGGNLGPESLAYGLPQPSAAQRIDRLSETCTILNRLWTGNEPVTFDGSHYHLVDARCEPRPVQVPRPPLLIGGVGEQKLLRVVAEYAAIWNVPGPPYLTVADFIRKNHVFDEHCATVHRDPTQITKSVQLNADLSNPAATRAQIAELTDAGARHIILSLPATDTSGIIGQLVDK